MNIIKKSIKALSAIAVAASLSSCDSFLKEYSQDLVKVNGWEDLEEIFLGDGLVLSTMPYIEDYTMSVGDRGFDLDILYGMSDELTFGNCDYDAIGLYSQFSFLTWQKDTGVNDEFSYTGGDERYWNELYRKINVLNMILAVIDEQPENVPEDKYHKERIKGQTAFLRAYYYFLLANLYGEPYDPATAESKPGVPFKDTEYVEDIEYKRGTLKETYERILADLDLARVNLEGKNRVDIYTPDVNAVNLLTARAYLYMQDWANAAKYAQEVISVQPEIKDFSSVNAPTQAVSEVSPEIIFSMGDHAIGFAFLDNYDWEWMDFDTPWHVSDDIMNLYADNDHRQHAYFGYTEEYDIFTLLKFHCQKSTFGSYHKIGSTFLMRTPEAYLILAEANLCQGKDGEARSALKKLIDKRFDSLSLTASGDELMEFIRDERAREFIIEGGHRWFDLRRYTVHSVYPWSKEIEHFYIYTANYKRDHADYYRLEKNDPAYTLPIPRSVREFQPSIGNNSRPDRKYFKREEFSYDDDDYDDEYYD